MFGFGVTVDIRISAEFTAGVAQLVEHDVANVVVDGSNPFARFFYFL